MNDERNNLIEQLINKYEIHGFDVNGEWDNKALTKLKALADDYHAAKCKAAPKSPNNTELLNTYKGREAEALLCMTQQRDDLLRDLGHASLTDVGLNALEVTEAKLKVAIEALQHIAIKQAKDGQAKYAIAKQALEKIGERTKP